MRKGVNVKIGCGGWCLFFSIASIGWDGGILILKDTLRDCNDISVCICEWRGVINVCVSLWVCIIYIYIYCICKSFNVLYGDLDMSTRSALAWILY